MSHPVTAASASAASPRQFPRRLPVWLWWEQGWSAAPAICRACGRSWAIANKETVDVRQLGLDDLRSVAPGLADLREGEWAVLTAQLWSDYLRLSLLSRFGGVWADATVLCTAPIAPWLKALGTPADGFFAFDRSGSHAWPVDPFAEFGLLSSSWFLVSLRPAHPLVDKLLDTMGTFIRCALTPPPSAGFAMALHLPYFSYHAIFCALIEADGSFSRAWSCVPKVSARFPHALEFELGMLGSNSDSGKADGAEVELLEAALSHAPMQKLSHKVLSDELLNALASTTVATSERAGGVPLLFASNLGRLCQRVGPGFLEWCLCDWACLPPKALCGLACNSATLVAYERTRATEAWSHLRQLARVGLKETYAFCNVSLQ